MISPSNSGPFFFLISSASSSFFVSSFDFFSSSYKLLIVLLPPSHVVRNQRNSHRLIQLSFEKSFVLHESIEFCRITFLLQCLLYRLWLLYRHFLLVLKRH